MDVWNKTPHKRWKSVANNSLRWSFEGIRKHEVRILMGATFHAFPDQVIKLHVQTVQLMNVTDFLAKKSSFATQLLTSAPPPMLFQASICHKYYITYQIIFKEDRSVKSKLKSLVLLNLTIMAVEPYLSCTGAPFS